MPLTTIAKKHELSEGKGVGKTVNNCSIALFLSGGKYYAIDDQCTHAGGSLSEGELSGTVVVCPWHGATFDIMTGTVLSEPAADNVKSYPVVVDGDELKIEI